MTVPRQQIVVRLTADMVERIDSRRKIAEVSSRNEWIEKALQWALDQPVRVRAVRVEEKL